MKISSLYIKYQTTGIFSHIARKKSENRKNLQESARNRIESVGSFSAGCNSKSQPPQAMPDFAKNP